MLVKVKGKGIKLNGKWCYKNEEVIIDEAEWEENKEYVDIIKDEEAEKLPQVPDKNDKDPEEIELLELRKKGKELGIKNAHFMGKEKLEQLIQEYENKKEEVSEDENTDGQNENTEDEDTDETKDGSDTDVGSNGESQPQE